MVRRAIKINGKTKTTILELEKVAEIKNVAKEFIHFDKLPSGNWRVVYTKDTIDFADTTSWEIVRED